MRLAPFIVRDDRAQSGNVATKSGNSVYTLPRHKEKEKGYETENKEKEKNIQTKGYSARVRQNPVGKLPAGTEKL